MEIGTLKELNVKPGDVVECVEGRGCAFKGASYTITQDRRLGAGEEHISRVTNSRFRIISRAGPKLWKDMSPEEKGALLLAAHEGKVIEALQSNVEVWYKARPSWSDNITYRIRPEPKVRSVDLYCGQLTVGALLKKHWSDTHRITFTTIDGVPDCSSIKMEKL